MIDTTNDDFCGEHFLKVPVIVRKDYRFRVEQHVHGAFAHCDVYNWSPAIAKALIKDWHTFRELRGGPIYVLHNHSAGILQRKFLKMLDFKWLCPHEDCNEIWIWRNNEQSI